MNGFRRLLWFPLLSLALCCAPGPSAVTGELVRVSPEDVGWVSERLDEVAAHAGELGFEALMMARDGQVFFAWGKTEKNYKLHSIRKPLLGALYGIHADEGVVDLDATVQELSIDDSPPRLTAEEKRATIRHLLQSRSGIYHEAAAETQQMKDARPVRGQYGPGEHFYYNNWDFNALGSIFTRLTGKGVFEAFAEKIAGPIGMQDFNVDDCEYHYSPSSEHPSYSFRMSARDLLRFGVLYQQRGLWNGVRVVPERWVDLSTTGASESIDEKTGAGFGYMWGVMAAGSPLAELAGGAGYFFSGLGRHAIVVIPELELVYVLRSDNDKPGETPKMGTLLTMIRDARVDAGRSAAPDPTRETTTRNAEK